MSYYLLQNGAQAGPFTESEIRQFLAEGKAHEADLGWREGLAEWQPLSSLGIASPAPPVVPTPATVPAATPPPYRVKSTPMGTATKMLIGIGAAGFLAILGVVIFAVHYVLHQNGEVRAYADQYLAHIAPAWSADELLGRVAPVYKSKFDPEEVRGFMSRLHALGALKTYDGSTPNSNYTMLNGVITTRVTAHAVFEHGDATFNLLLVKEGGEWRLGGFHVLSPILK